MKISCVTASYVADLMYYPGEIDWTLATERIVSAPLMSTIDDIMDRLSPVALDGIEFWYPHVWPQNLTLGLVSEIRRRLGGLGMKCSALAGGIADPDKSPYSVEELFQAAYLLESPLIAGHMSADVVPKLSGLCAKYGVAVGYENALEKSGSDIVKLIQTGDEWVGATLDTGNLVSRGGDPVRAVRELGERLMHVHLKDVPAVGSQDCVALGQGIVDVAGVIHQLQGIGYDDWLSIEVETADRDPTDDILISVDVVRSILGGQRIG